MKLNWYNRLLNNPRTHWQWYKSFFNLTVLRYLVTWFSIVPVIVNILKGINEPIIIQSIVQTSVQLNLSLPFTWEILWMSSFAYVISLLLYQAFCPGFIKTYSSFKDYKLHQHSPRWVIWEALNVLNDKNEIGKLFDRLYTKKYVELTSENLNKNEVVVEENQSVAYFVYKEKSYKLALPVIESGNINDEKTEIREREIFWEIFGRFSSSRRLLRFLILLFLVISGVLFSIVFIQNIMNGFRLFCV